MNTYFENHKEKMLLLYKTLNEKVQQNKAKVITKAN